MKITFAGYGSMAKALARGLSAAGFTDLHAFAPSLTRAVDGHGVITTSHPSEALCNAEVVILAVKPQQMQEVMAAISAYIPASCLLISVAAGLSCAFFAETANEAHALVRAMPNLAAAFNEGATALFANAWTTPAQKNTAEVLFAAVGRVAWLKHEEDMDAFTALAGSGPAYVFLFLEALEKGAIALGLDEETSRVFALQTLKGAVAVCTHSNETFATLRDKVTSPAGTTAAALAILKTRGFEDVIADALRAAAARSRELLAHGRQKQ
ncbi:pyrroline-5-carboxylate reductase [Legionella geestiana]|uniref:Pyrroline-5-carboxylate reductase n=1 Tax=Legionella geestiana TaxID=45065 RepID=A0A0W0U246_9GAMM|nr:pyrroline-5-carboxylate reductase [Legionella geestiana]KTD02005.1 pyrroline-5-carboxylate reductase [Legionella geestiana]QBS12047.1 pyrroline-5-carboxylate reductase [Legionella geestiana]QDQ40343.1 pyrroline-5-carboxylate reductase [Legionella geestiana]STX53233.1 pyrroline-5-carboxylate reductase [Legionella geestiana]